MSERRRERKVVTVLFADLVGFTSRAEALDPEDVEAILHPYHERLRAELERHGGTVEKFIGDAVVAVFGAPVVHEDDAERAVRAALAIRDAIVDDGTLEVRIGVNTGEALVNVDARPDAGEGMAAGDVVNTGARLQAAAPTNGVLVGETTYRATERAIEYREHEPIQAKGKTEPVPVCEALQARSRVDVEVQRPRAPLVGRDRELDVLADALVRVRQERSAQLVTLVGEPGIGKSRLVYELSSKVDADSELIWWRQGRSLPYGEGVSFWALGQMVKTQAGILENDSTETAEQKLRIAVEGMQDAEWLIGHLRALVGLGGEMHAGPDQRGEAFTAWRRFCEELAEQRPLVLVFEDLHWADDGLLDFVDHLVDWASGVPMLVVASARPELLERRPGWGGGKRNATTISLSPLAREDSARLLAGLLERSVLPAETQAALLQRAGGNPLYTEEFARMLTDQGDTEDLPESLQGVIAARLDVLAPEQKALLQQAAVIGRVFWIGALEAMNGASRRELEERLHGLERKEFVRRERRSSVEGDDEYLFLHVLVRDVAYGQIPRAERAEKHERAAGWIERLGRAEDTAEMLAHHYVQALEYARASGLDTKQIEEPACQALGEAGARAFSLNAYEASERFSAAALELAEHGSPAWSRLVVQRVRAMWHWRMFAAQAEIERACSELEERGFTEEAAETGGFLSWSAWVGGDRVRAKAAALHARDLLASAPPSEAKASVLNEVGRLLAMEGSGAEGLEMTEQALAMAEDLGLVELELSALNNRGLARADLGDPEALADIERSIELALESGGGGTGIVRGYGNLASLVFLEGDLARAVELHEAAFAEARRVGMDSAIRWQQGEQVALEYLLGRWDDLLRHTEEWFAGRTGSSHFMDGLGADPSRARPGGARRNGRGPRGRQAPGRAIGRARPPIGARLACALLLPARALRRADDCGGAARADPAGVERGWRQPDVQPGRGRVRGGSARPGRRIPRGCRARPPDAVARGRRRIRAS